MRKNPIVEVTFVRSQYDSWLSEFFTVYTDNRRRAMCAEAAVELFGAPKGVPGSLHITASRTRFAGGKRMVLSVNGYDYVTLPSGESVALTPSTIDALRLLFPDAKYGKRIYKFYFKAEFTPAVVPASV